MKIKIEIFVYCSSFAFTGDYAISGNKKGNIAIVDQKNQVSLQHSEFLEENVDESGFKKVDVRMSNSFNPPIDHASPISIDDTEDSIIIDANASSSLQQSTANISIISID